MLTIFCLPKAFLGRTARIQHNTFQSWSRLSPRPEILVFGDEEGVAAAAARFGARHVPQVDRSEHGTPLVNTLFRRAQELAINDLVCYVNADIILMSDFMPAVRAVAQARRPFLMGGRRWDLDMPDGWSGDGPDWEGKLRGLVRTSGRRRGSGAIDYFLFHRGLYPSIPPFAIGRTCWDNWLLYEARRRGADLIDATKSITIVHQNHDLSHLAGKDLSAGTKGLEFSRNRELAGLGIFTLNDATLSLENAALRKRRWRLRRAIKQAGRFRPWLNPAAVAVLDLAKALKGMRDFCRGRRPGSYRPVPPPPVPAARVDDAQAVDRSKTGG